MSNRMKFLVAGSVTYVAAVTAGYYYSTIYQHQHLNVQKKEIKLEDSKRQQTYAKLAKHYDQGRSNQLAIFLALVTSFYRDWW